MGSPPITHSPIASKNSDAMNPPAIVFIHRNCPSVESFSKSVLGICIRQAASIHSGVPILLIGDRDPKRPDLCEFVAMDRLQFVSRDLESNYRHTSTNDLAYELFCIERWLLLAELMRERGYTACIHLDSDVLAFANLWDELRREFSQAEVGCCQLDFAALSTSPILKAEKFCSMHTAYLKRSPLEAFCLFVHRVFSNSNQWKTHEQFCQPFLDGGIISGLNDMSLWSEFLYQTEERWEVTNLCGVIRGATVDFNSNASLGYEMNGALRLYDWINHMPHARSLDGGEPVRHRTIHCQGAAKQHLSRLVRCELLDA